MKIKRIVNILLVLLLVLSVFVAPCMAFSENEEKVKDASASFFPSVNREEVRDVLFSSFADVEKGQLIQVSFKGEDNRGILLVFATEREEDGGLKQLSLQNETDDDSVLGVSTSGAILVEDYDGSPYTFPVAGLRGDGNISVILLGENKISMGTIEYSVKDQYVSLGEEREIPAMVEGEASFYQLEDTVYLQYGDFVGLGYKVFIQFPGATKEGILMVFAENEGGLHSFDETWLEKDTKVQLLEDFQGGEHNIYSFPAEDLGKEDGRLYFVLIDKNEGMSIMKADYSPSSPYFLKSMIADSSPKI